MLKHPTLTKLIRSAQFIERGKYARNMNIKRQGALIAILEADYYTRAKVYGTRSLYYVV